MPVDPLLAALASLAPQPGNLPSPLRLRIRATFDGITAARKRGVTWNQIVALMTEDGVRSLDGTPPNAKQVCTIYNTERRQRGGRRQRKKKPPISHETGGEPDLTF